MDLKNVTLKTAELGPVLWSDTEKLQAGDGKFLFFIDYTIEKRPSGMDEEEQEILVGTYIEIPQMTKPTKEEVIDYIVREEYKGAATEEQISEITNEVNKLLN